MKDKSKDARDPNKPKRPPSAFFVFMEEFRKQYKIEHPNNKSVGVVGRAGGEKWKSMNEQEKATYVGRALHHKLDYVQKMESYKKKPESSSEESNSGDYESYNKKPESSRRSEQMITGNRNHSVLPQATSSSSESVISALHRKIEKALEAYHTNLRDDINIKILKELKEEGGFELLGLELRLAVWKILHDHSYMLAWRSMSSEKRIEWLQREITNLQNYVNLERK